MLTFGKQQQVLSERTLENGGGRQRKQGNLPADKSSETSLTKNSGRANGEGQNKTETAATKDEARSTSGIRKSRAYLGKELRSSPSVRGGESSPLLTFLKIYLENFEDYSELARE